MKGNGPGCVTKRMQDKKVVLFAKDKPGLKKALGILRKCFGIVDSFIGKVGDPFPRGVERHGYDICISYLSPWIVPSGVLDSIREFSINFHPGPPEYRGIGCTNFAIYNGETKYGVTAHLMAANVDSGRIVDVARFAISPGDTVYSLTQKCYDHLARQFHRVFEKYVSTGALSCCSATERWSDRLYTRRELNDLCRLSPDMEKDEIARRIKATAYPAMQGACLELHGYRFVYMPEAHGK
ncbi:MAG: hypothetical protein JXB40_00080 [Candidatus Omnitrophica bacterium]|nr:hypothetical protein [Candidatus Omnitrophota bacterium]